MNTSTEIGSVSKIVGEERAVEYVAKAGFDAWDFSMFSMFKYDWRTKRLSETDHPLAGKDYLKFARNLRRIGLDNGIVCNQSHAPFPTLGKEVYDFLKRAIECTAEAGGEICVIHPNNNFSAIQNAEIYFELLPFAKSCGVKIAAENMWNWNDKRNEAAPAACSSPEDFKAHLAAVNDDFFVACLDIGHAEMRGLNTSAHEMILALGDKLQALHIHDNDKWHDSHDIPCSMSMDFDAVISALAKVNYSGYFTLEADRYLANINSTPENVFAGICNMSDAARKMCRCYYEKKSEYNTKIHRN